MDRREEPRVVYGAWVQLVTEEVDSPHFFRAVNLSRGGILLRAPTSGWAAINPGRVHEDPRMPDVGHLVDIRLVIENERRVMNVSGEVIHHSGDRFGVRFLDLDCSQREFIEALADELPETEDERQTPSGLYQHTKPH